jgi:hypothetical protein
MDRHDRLRALLAGTGCTVCGGRLAVDRIRVLAERDALAFVELPCPDCGAATLGMVTERADGSASLDVAAPEPRPAGTAPIDLDDVMAMRRFLAAYRGDLRSIVGGGTADDHDAGNATPGPGR